MIPKTLFLAFLSLQVQDEQPVSSAPHALTITVSPFQHELQTVVKPNPFQNEVQTVFQKPTRFERDQPFSMESVNSVDFDTFEVGQHESIYSGPVQLYSEAGWIVPGYWFGKDWKFPSGRQQAYAINPTTNPRLTLRFHDGAHKNVNMTISFWDYDIPKKVQLKTLAGHGSAILDAPDVVLQPGWNNWRLEASDAFDEFTIDVQGKATTDKDLLIIDSLTWE